MAIWTLGQMKHTPKVAHMMPACNLSGDMKRLLTINPNLVEFNFDH